MGTIIVYQTEENGEYQTFSPPPSASKDAIEAALAQKTGLTPGELNWYGTSAQTPEAAIEEARNAGFKYRKPEGADTIIVYQTEQDGEYKTFAAAPNLSHQSIDRALAQKEGLAPGSQLNWFGASAETPEAAIEEAKQAGLTYRSPKEMGEISQRHDNVQQQVQQALTPWTVKHPKERGQEGQSR